FLTRDPKALEDLDNFCLTEWPFACARAETEYGTHPVYTLGNTSGVDVRFSGECLQSLAGGWVGHHLAEDIGQLVPVTELLKGSPGTHLLDGHRCAYSLGHVRWERVWTPIRIIALGIETTSQDAEGCALCLFIGGRILGHLLHGECIAGVAWF